MRRPSTKTCASCRQPAQYSVATHISVLGVSPRRQKCSSVVLFCESCIRQLSGTRRRTEAGRVIQGERMTRKRFQRGSIYKRGKRKRVWIARYCEDVIGPNGAVTRIRRSDILGTVAEIPTRRQAEQLLAGRLRSVNSSEYRPSSSRTFRDYVENCWLPEVLPTLKYSSKKLCLSKTSKCLNRQELYFFPKSIFRC